MKKKIVSLGIASAVLALTSAVASAEGEVSPSINVNESLTEGGSFSVDIELSDDISDISFSIETEGLEFDEASADDDVEWNEGEKTLTIGETEIKSDTTVLTVTYNVTAKAGENASFKLVSDDSEVDTAKYELSVKADEGGNSGSDSTDDKSGTGGITSGGESSETSESQAVSDSEPTSESTASGNPTTGIALAVVPVVLAGAGVIAAQKKR